MRRRCVAVGVGYTDGVGTCSKTCGGRGCASGRGPCIRVRRNTSSYLYRCRPCGCGFTTDVLLACDAGYQGSRFCNRCGLGGSTSICVGDGHGVGTCSQSGSRSRSLRGRGVPRIGVRSGSASRSSGSRSVAQTKACGCGCGGCCAKRSCGLGDGEALRRYARVGIRYGNRVGACS